MNISTKDWDDIFINKTGKKLLDNINEPITKIKKSDSKLYLTRTQKQYLNLIASVSNLSFVEDNNLKSFMYNIIDKKVLDEINIIKYKKNIVHIIQNIKPFDLYKYIEQKLDLNKVVMLHKFKNLFIPNENIKCSLCNNISYKFNFCNVHYQERGINEFKNIVNFLFSNIDYNVLLYFLKLIDIELINEIKKLTNVKKTQNVSLKIMLINSLLSYSKKYNNVDLDYVIHNYIIQNNPELRSHYGVKYIKLNKQIKKDTIERIKKINIQKIIEHVHFNKFNDYFTLTKIDSAIYIKYIKYHLRTINRMIYSTNKLINLENKILSTIFQKKYIDQFINNEIEKNPKKNMKYDVVERLYNSKFNLINLTIDKYFDDHFYNLENSLTYDIYGEIYNTHFNKYIPFIINIEKINSVPSYLKLFYCFVNGISVINTSFNKINNFKHIGDRLNIISNSKSLFNFE